MAQFQKASIHAAI
uniref:Uncharacterized protein n=1 Tax=Arundo donax TaxID=35708 RepID=A0A0A8Z455_ARUDO